MISVSLFKKKCVGVLSEFSKKAYQRKRAFTGSNTETLYMNTEKLKADAIIFDLDGTIVNSQDAYSHAAKTAFKEMGLEPPTTQTILQIPKRLEQKLPIGDIVPTDRTRFLDVYLKTFYAVTAEKTKPIPKIHVALEGLQLKAKLAVITMRYFPKAKVAEELQKFGLAKYFNVILTAEDTNKPKPSPEALKKALEIMDVKICDCLIVGDSVIDIAAGKAAGAKTIAVLSGLYSKKELAKLNPDLILKDATKLLNFIS